MKSNFLCIYSDTSCVTQTDRRQSLEVKKGTMVSQAQHPTNQTSHLILAGTPVGYILLIIDILLMVPICSGNALVLLAYRTTPALQVPCNMLLVNLAVTDIVTGLFSIPWTCFIHYVPLGWEFEK